MWGHLWKLKRGHYCTLINNKDLQKLLSVSHATQSIAVIEGYSESKEIQVQIDPCFYSKLSECLTPGFVLESAWGEFSAGAMTQILTEVRSRLLDFVLDLSDALPGEIDESNFKETSKQINVSDLFKNAVFGDNNTILVGDGNRQQVENIIVKNDLNSLLQMLQKEGISETDLSELATAIEADVDSHEVEYGNLGRNVTNWIGEMIKKAGSTLWDINIGAAASLLATAIGKFYGF